MYFFFHKSFYLLSQRSVQITIHSISSSPKIKAKGKEQILYKPETELFGKYIKTVGNVTFY